MIRGFVKLKKIQKSEKNSEVGGWVKPQLGFLFFGGFFFCVFFVLFSCSKCFKKKMDRGVGGFCLTNPSFWIFFNLTRPLTEYLLAEHVSSPNIVHKNVKGPGNGY